VALETEFEPVRRFEVSTTDEGEAEEFIRRVYIENHARFHGIGESARLRATVAEARGVAVDHFRSTIDYSVACDPFGYYLFFSISNGCLRLRCAGQETIVPAGCRPARC
jgi:hypothetical protein